MSGYDFDEVSVNKGVYCPRGLGNVEQELHAISRAFLEVLDGKRGIPVWVLDPSSSEIRASELESGDPHPALRETQPKNEILNMPQRYTFPPRLTDPALLLRKRHYPKGTRVLRGTLCDLMVPRWFSNPLTVEGTEVRSTPYKSIVRDFLGS